MEIDIKSRPATVREDMAVLELERSQYLAAACRASEVYPGALGELVHRELVAFAECGYRMAGDGFVQRLAAEVLDEVHSAGRVPRQRSG
jgi:hypothetical protein